MAPPYKQSQFEVKFGKGIDKLGELIQLASDFEIIKKWGKQVTFKDTKYELSEFEDLIKNSENFFKEIKEEVVNKIKNTEICVENE